MVKLNRLRQALDVSTDMLGQDLQNAAFWMDIRKLEKPEREFGAPPSALWAAFRQVVPFRRDPSAPPVAEPVGNQIGAFLRTTSPRSFYNATAIALPGGENVRPPLADRPGQRP